MTDWGLCKYFCTMLGNFKGYNCKRFPMVNKNREDELGVRIVFGLLVIHGVPLLYYCIWFIG